MRVPEILVLTLALVSCGPEAPVADHELRVGPPASQIAAVDPWRASISPRIHDASLAFHPDGDGFVAGRVLTARFDIDGAHITVGQDTIGLTAELVGAGSSTPDPVAPTLGACLDELVGPDGDCIRRLEYSTAGLTEWWVTQDAGFEQGWTIDQRPGTGPLLIDVAVEGADAVVGETEVWLQGDAGGLLMVRELQAWDADGVELSARFVRVDGGFRIHVDDQGARYPVTIDPVYTTASWTATGAIADEDFGQAAAGAGDVNGDGYDDVIVGAGSAYETSPGHAYVYLGSATGLSDVASTTLTGSAAADLFGSAVAGAGDVNGDGYDDVIVGAQTETWGVVTVYMGSATGVSSTPAITLNGGTSTSQFGNAVATAGDVNGDGYDDVIVGANGYRSSTGRAYVYLGGALGLESTASTTVDGSAAGDNFGVSVSSAGDVDADGYDDVIVGADGYDGHAGMARAYLGSAAGVSSTPTATFTTGATYGHLGRSVSSAGDVNGDGYDDVVVGAPFYSAGRSLVYQGYAGGVATTASTTLDGERVYDLFGWSVAGAGDVNGDGYADVIVGAPENGASIGRAYFYLGSRSGLSSTATTVLTGGAGDGSLSDPVAAAGDVNGDGYGDVVVGSHRADDGAGRVYLYSGGSAGLARTAATTIGGAPRDEFGTSVADAGDVNNDGYEDVIVGASASGLAYVYLGSAAGLGTTAATTLSGESTSDQFGWSVSGAGDVNADGYDDVVVGANGFDAATGRVYVYLGGPDGVQDTASTTLTGEAARDSFGLSVSGAGDVNGDGYDDVIVGADGHDSYTGRAYVYLGGAAGIASTAMTTLDGAAVYAFFGETVSDAGDVDADGYADVIVGGSPAYVYLGSASGTSVTADSTLDEGSGSGAGDVNGDGYDDVILSGDGFASVYEGSPTGVSSTASATLTGGADAFGSPASGVGDVDGDGYDDVVVSGSESSDTGYVLVFSGSSSGTSTPASTRLEIASDGDYPFGTSVSGADVNGDGLADILVGAPDNGSAYAFYGYVDTDGDGVVLGTDCDDADASVGAATDWYPDADGDGYGASPSATACDQPAAYVATPGDCDDTNATFHPGAPEPDCTDPSDYNCDGSAGTDDTDADGYTLCDDCDDSDAAVNPGAPEVCNGLDDDCDGLTDDASAVDLSTFYADIDGDGLGSETSIQACDMPSGHVASTTDCDDADPTIGVATRWYLDADSDTYGSTTSLTACDAPASYVATSGDCDDTNPDFHPGAPEADCTDPNDYNCDGTAGTDDDDADGYTACTDCDDANAAANPAATEACNGFDDNCDGLTDDASAIDPSTFYADADRDGFGSAASIQACDPPTGYVASNTDCDDTDSAIHAASTTWYPDVDGDGYGSSIGGVVACDAPDYTVADSSDCDDADPLVHPGTAEMCNGIDDDCSGDIDDDAVDATDWYRDRDEDGYGLGPAFISECLQPEGRVADGTDCDDYDATVHPGADDIPDDRIDQDCDGHDATTDTGEPLDTDEADTDIPDPKKSPGCGCASLEDPGSGALGLALLALGIVLRQRRR